MRSFTEYEKRIIRAISDADEIPGLPGDYRFNCGQFIMNQCRIVSVGLDIEPPLGDFLTIEHQNECPGCNMVKEIASVFTVFKILQKNHLVMVLRDFYNDHGNYINQRFLKRDEKGFLKYSAPSGQIYHYHSWSHINSDIVEYFESYSYPTEALKEWIDCGFSTQEQIYAEKQLKKAPNK